MEARAEFGITAPNGLIILTESGYLMLVKSFTDDLAWDVQRELVNSYFRLETTAVPVLLEPIQAPNASMGEVGRFVQSIRLMMEKENIPAPIIAQTIAKMGGHGTWNFLQNLSRNIRGLCMRIINYRFS